MAGPTLSEHTTTLAAKVSTGVSYTASGGLTAAGMLDFLNNNALAFGVVLGMATFFVNWYYQRKHLRLAEQQAIAKRNAYASHLYQDRANPED
jgi:hypothetical protein